MINCPRCTEDNNGIRPNGPHQELYCKSCGCYIKFANKSEMVQLKKSQRKKTLVWRKKGDTNSEN